MGARSLLKSLPGVPSIGKADPSPTVGEVGVVLKNERRRMVIYALAETDQDRLMLGSVAETIASAECEKPPAQLESDERRRVYIALYQTHLSKLDKMDVIEYNGDRGTIEQGPKFRSMFEVLETVADECVDDSTNGAGSGITFDISSCRRIQTVTASDDKTNNRVGIGILDKILIQAGRIYRRRFTMDDRSDGRNGGERP